MVSMAFSNGDKVVWGRRQRSKKKTKGRREERGQGPTKDVRERKKKTLHW